MARANLLKTSSSPTVFGSHVLGTKVKLPTYQNFDLRLKSENIKF